MDTKNGVAEYEDFIPSSELVQEEDCDTLLLYLPAFKKEQLRVQLTKRILKISGSRPLGHNKWSRFQKEFPVSTNCDTNHINARFEGGILYVKQPKIITLVEKHRQESPASKASEPENHSDDHPQTQKKNAPEKDQEKVEQETTNGKETSHHEEMKTSFPGKSAEETKISDKPMIKSMNADEKRAKASTGNEYGIGKTRLKFPGRVMNVFLAGFLALVVGICVSNWIMSPRKS